ncbi:MAG: ATP-binding cassette domain-containing protein [Planctomycetota bacterium]|jgi:osmoprotectant transport system ATP-binding protein
MLALEQVSKSFEGTVVLRDVDLEVPRGRTTALIGPSGCGKSTAIRLMIGLIRPDAGTVRFDGRVVDPDTARPLRRRMGYVIQSGGLFPHLTARRNAVLMAGELGWSADRMTARLAELAELTSFPADGLDRYPEELSGGQRQRVSLMRALMLDPDVLLLDEPLGALDPMIRHDLQDDLRRIFRRLEKTVLLVTHDLGEAGFLGDDVVLMRDGCIVQRGSITELLHEPADEFVERFICAQRSHLDEGDAS